MKKRELGEGRYEGENLINVRKNLTKNMFRFIVFKEERTRNLDPEWNLDWDLFDRLSQMRMSDDRKTIILYI